MASFWNINSRNFRKGGGGGNDHNAQYTPLYSDDNYVIWYLRKRCTHVEVNR